MAEKKAPVAPKPQNPLPFVLAGGLLGAAVVWGVLQQQQPAMLPPAPVADAPDPALLNQLQTLHSQVAQLAEARDQLAQLADGLHTFATAGDQLNQRLDALQAEVTTLKQTPPAQPVGNLGLVLQMSYLESSLRAGEDILPGLALLPEALKPAASELEAALEGAPPVTLAALLAETQAVAMKPLRLVPPPPPADATLWQRLWARLAGMVTIRRLNDGTEDVTLNDVTAALAQGQVEAAQSLLMAEPLVSMPDLNPLRQHVGMYINQRHALDDLRQAALKLVARP